MSLKRNNVSCPEKDRFSGVSFSKVFTLLRCSVPEKEDLSCPEKDRFSGVSFSKVFTLLRCSVPEKECCFLS